MIARVGCFVPAGDDTLVFRRAIGEAKAGRPCKVVRAESDCSGPQNRKDGQGPKRLNLMWEPARMNLANLYPYS